MTTQVAQQSSYFPFGNNGAHENQVAARRTALVSFPQTREVLWDSEKTGNSITLHLTCSRNVIVRIAEKTIRLAYQHAVHAKATLYQGFFVGSIETDAEEEGIIAVMTRFDPGRDVPHGQGPVLTARLPGDFVVPVCLSFEKGDRGQQTHGEKDFSSAFQFLDHSIGSRGGVDLTNTISLRIHCSCYEGADDITLSLHHGAVLVRTPVEVTPINPIPVIPTALARNLAGPLNISQLQKNHKFGFLTMDQTRKLLLLLDTDPKAYALPLIGIWVSGVNYIHSPVVYAACLKYLYSKSIQDRATSPTGGFVLLFYSPLQKQPQFYECTKANDAHNLTFDLIGCKEQLHIYKHADSSLASDIRFELTSARGGPSKELFLQTLRKFDLQSGSPKTNQQRASTSEADPHLVLRPSPKPTLNKSPSIFPSVPEVSLIFDNSENPRPAGKMLTSPPGGPRRPGPLRDLNQGPSQTRSGLHIGRRQSTAADQENLARNAHNRSERGVPRRRSPGNSPPGQGANQKGGGIVSNGKENERRGSSSRRPRKSQAESNSPVDVTKETAPRNMQGGSTSHGGMSARIPEDSVDNLGPANGRSWDSDSQQRRHGPRPQTMNNTHPSTNQRGIYRPFGQGARSHTDSHSPTTSSDCQNSPTINPRQMTYSNSPTGVQQQTFPGGFGSSVEHASSGKDRGSLSSEDERRFSEGHRMNPRQSFQPHRFHDSQRDHTVLSHGQNKMSSVGQNLGQHLHPLQQQAEHGVHAPQQQPTFHRSQSEPSLSNQQQLSTKHHDTSHQPQSSWNSQPGVYPVGSSPDTRVQHSPTTPMEHQSQRAGEVHQHQQALHPPRGRQSTSPLQEAHRSDDQSQLTEGPLQLSGQQKQLQHSLSSPVLGGAVMSGQMNQHQISQRSTGHPSPPNVHPTGLRPQQRIQQGPLSPSGHRQQSVGQIHHHGEPRRSPGHQARTHQSTSPMQQLSASGSQDHNNLQSTGQHPVGHQYPGWGSQVQHSTGESYSPGGHPHEAGRENSPGKSLSSGHSGEESPFVQLKKQERMIEQLQEQIKYLLQMQTGSLSPGQMTPPATPPSSKGSGGFIFPTPDSSGGNPAHPVTLPSTVAHPPHQGATFTDDEQHPRVKHTATISTNTGQSLFFSDQSASPPLGDTRGGPADSGLQEGSYRDGHLDGPATDSSVPGSVSDSALSGDPGFHVDLQNTKDDTHSFGSRVELTSYPDSASVKSSSDGSPVKDRHPDHVTPPRSQSVNSGDNTIVASPPMPTLVSPVLGESASTCQPRRPYQNSGWSGGQGLNNQAIPEESSDGSYSEHADRNQTPSLLQKDQRQFYQNLLGNVEDFLHDEDKEVSGSDEEGSSDNSGDQDRTSSSEDETSEDEESAALNEPGKSVLFRSLMSSPDFHPHINYVSLADVGLGPSDISIEADAIAMKYLSDEELAKVSSEAKGGGGREGVNPLLRNVLTAGLPANMSNERSMFKSRVEFSFATRKYLEKHGLEGSSKIGNTPTGVERRKEKVRRKKKSRRKEKVKRDKGRDFERVLPLKGEMEGKEGMARQEQLPPNTMEQAVSLGNILDWNKLKTLPKLL